MNATSTIISESTKEIDMEWRRYQDDIAVFFRTLGCNADVEANVIGARAEHKVDVWVRFTKFGVNIKGAIEAKSWNSAVPKEKVLTLRSLVDDVGADRGILISTAGFQRGAVRAAEKTNITLTKFDGLRENAREELSLSVFHGLETKSIRIRRALHGLYVTEKRGAHSWTSRARPGVDGRLVMRTVGALAFLDDGFEKIRLNESPPYVVSLDDKNRRIIVDTVDEFILEAGRIIEEADSVLVAQEARQTD